MKLFGAVVFLISCAAQAGFLRMASTSDLQLVEKNGQIWIQGNYEIENQGDETAKDVFARLRLDGWQWSFEKRTLNAGEKTIWTVNEKIDRSVLCTQISGSCLRALPLKGDFFVQVEKNYQDQNSYPFSTPEVLSLSLGKKRNLSTGRELLTGTMKIKLIGENEYQGDYQILNKTKDPQKLTLHFLFPKEVQLGTTDLPLDIEPSGDLNGTFYFKNVSGLMGSDYLSLMVVEVVHENERLFFWEPARFRIQSYRSPLLAKVTSKFTLAQGFFFAMGLLSVLGAIFIYLYWERPRRQY